MRIDERGGQVIRGHQLRDRFAQMRDERLAVPELQIMNEKFQIHETAAQQLGRDRAIEPAAVEIAQSEMIGEAAREGALAGRRRPIDGDNHGHS